MGRKCWLVTAKAFAVLPVTSLLVPIIEYCYLLSNLSMATVLPNNVFQVYLGKVLTFGLDHRSKSWDWDRSWTGAVRSAPKKAIVCAHFCEEKSCKLSAELQIQTRTCKICGGSLWMWPKLPFSLMQLVNSWTQIFWHARIVTATYP